MSSAQENWKSLKPKAHRKTQLKFDFHLRFLLCIAGPDYNIGIVGKCLGPATYVEGAYERWLDNIFNIRWSINH